MFLTRRGEGVAERRPGFLTEVVIQNCERSPVGFVKMLVRVVMRKVNCGVTECEVVNGYVVENGGNEGMCKSAKRMDG